MKRRTYNNVRKSVEMIMKKGYDRKTANELALQCFDNAENNKNGMPIEWYIDKIISKSEYDEGILCKSKQS